MVETERRLSEMILQLQMVREQLFSQQQQQQQQQEQNRVSTFKFSKISGKTWVSVKSCN